MLFTGFVKGESRSTELKWSCFYMDIFNPGNEKRATKSGAQRPFYFWQSDPRVKRGCDYVHMYILNKIRIKSSNISSRLAQGGVKFQSWVKHGVEISQCNWKLKSLTKWVKRWGGLLTLSVQLKPNPSVENSHVISPYKSFANLDINLWKGLFGGTLSGVLSNYQRNNVWFQLPVLWYMLKFSSMLLKMRISILVFIFNKPMSSRH